MNKYKITIEKFDRTDIEGGAYIDENKEKILELTMAEEEYLPLSKRILNILSYNVNTDITLENVEIEL